MFTYSSFDTHRPRRAMILPSQKSSQIYPARSFLTTIAHGGNPQDRVVALDGAPHRHATCSNSFGDASRTTETATLGNSSMMETLKIALPRKTAVAYDSTLRHNLCCCHISIRAVATPISPYFTNGFSHLTIVSLRAKATKFPNYVYHECC